MKKRIASAFFTVLFAGMHIHAMAALVTPTNLRSKIGDWYGDNTTLHIALTWDSNTTDKVILEMSSDGSNFAENNRSVAGDNTVGSTSLNYGEKKWFRVRAYTNTELSGYSNTISFVTFFPPPEFQSTVNSKTSVSLFWLDYNDFETAHLLERSTDPSFPAGNTTTLTVNQPYMMVKHDPYHQNLNFVAYTDNFSFQPMKYYYRVRATSAVGNGEPGKTISVSPATVPDPIIFVAAYTTNLSDNGQSSTRVGVTFGYSPSFNNQGYRIDRSPNGVNGWTEVKRYTDIPNAPFIDDGSVIPLVAGQTYFYRVVAYNDVGDSPFTAKKVVLPNPAPAGNTVWYIDGQVAAGNNTGTSWANAWANFSSINWYAIKPGDTLVASGGSSGLTYDEVLYVSAGGTEASPVTIKVGFDPSHNGRVKLRGVVLLKSWVTVDGAKDPNFQFSNLSEITTNQNIEVSDTTGACVFSSSPLGDKVKWLDIHDCGLPTHPEVIAGNVCGIQFNGDTTGIRGAEVAYSHVRDTWGQGIGVSGPSNRYGDAAIHHNIVENTHNDFIITSGGVDIYNNIAHTRATPDIGHPDGFQIWAPYIRIYNNIIYDTPGQTIYIELALQDASHIQIYNNVLYSDQMMAGSAIGFTTEPSSFLPTMTLGDVLIANNLIYGIASANFYISKRDSSVGTLLVRNMTVKNNIFYLPSSLSASVIGFGGSYGVNDIVFDNNIITGGAANKVSYLGIDYSSPEALNAATPYKHNTSGTPQFANKAGFDFRLASNASVGYDGGADLSSFATNAPSVDSDINGVPRPQGSSWDIGPYEFYSGQIQDTKAPTAPTNLHASVAGTQVTLSWSPSQDNFRVAGYKVFRNGVEVGSPTSVAFVDSGLAAHTVYSYTVKAFDPSNNMSALSAPIQVTTLAGSGSRIGLALKFNFDQDFSNGVTDLSGHNNNGIKYDAAHWPSATTGPDGTPAALFSWGPTPTPGYYGAGDYIGVPASPTLNPLGQATISAWASYDANSDPTSTLVDGASYIGRLGSWKLGRDHNGNTEFTLYSDKRSSPINLLSFPDLTTCGGGHSGDTCNTDGWHHYVVTFDGATFKNYYDGQLVSSAPSPDGISQLVLSPVGNYINVGSWVHDGTPQWDYGQLNGDMYPNCCWMSGGIDDLRIYDVALGQSDINKLFQHQDVTVNTGVPTVAFATPAPGARVSGSISVGAGASTTGLGIAGVSFMLDGTDLGSEIASAPYSLSWDTTQVADGNHTLTVVARDLNNTFAGAAISVLVSNHGGSATPTAAEQGQTTITPFKNILMPTKGEKIHISYNLAHSVHVTLTLYDRAGHEIKKLVNEDRAAGAYIADWDGRNLQGSTVASGVYILVMKAGDVSQTRKIVVVK